MATSPSPGRLPHAHPVRSNPYSCCWCHGEEAGCCSGHAAQSGSSGLPLSLSNCTLTPSSRLWPFPSASSLPLPRFSSQSAHDHLLAEPDTPDVAYAAFALPHLVTPTNTPRTFQSPLYSRTRIHGGIRPSQLVHVSYDISMTLDMIINLDMYLVVNLKWPGLLCTSCIPSVQHVCLPFQKH